VYWKSKGLRGAQVYDVTKFLDQHPGGRDQLLLGIGRDASLVFDSYHKASTLKCAALFDFMRLVER
jgi:cytochrome b involved in lipid metabolism